MKNRLSTIAALPHMSTGRHSRLHFFTQYSRHTWLPIESRPLLRPRSYVSTSRGERNSSKPCDYDNANARPADDLNHNITQEEKDHFAKKLREDKGKQIRTPWHREGSDLPPVHRQRSASAMTKGKLLTTPSRMLKMILPLTTHDNNTDRKDMEPLALLVHPQQPISYLERLIQSELPSIKDKEGRERQPRVCFRAEDSMQNDAQPSRSSATTASQARERRADQQGEEDFEKADEIRINGKTEKTGKLHRRENKATALRGGPGQGGVESYSGLGQEAASDKRAARKFVRWSSSTEIGDFIRDAARGQEFEIEIEGAPEEIRVGVPSFNERTYYLRMRLRKTSRKISEMANIKKECDELARRAAKNVAKAGFAGVVGWWGVVYYLTFQTELGWDVMEPVTYLVGLSTLIGGYMWFLYHNREVSYQSAMNFTVSRRQQKLYAQHQFDLSKWEALIDDGNSLRKEIKAVAMEYDVDWDELAEEKDEKVAEALKADRAKKERKNSDDEAEDEDSNGEGNEPRKKDVA